jgi:hypothetical protein
MTHFTNPYKNLPNLTRLQTYIDKADHDFIKSIHPDKGTLEITANTLWFKLCKALKKAKINQLSEHDKFEHFISSFEISIPEIKQKVDKKKL